MWRGDSFSQSISRVILRALPDPPAAARPAAYSAVPCLPAPPDGQA